MSRDGTPVYGETSSFNSFFFLMKFVSIKNAPWKAVRTARWRHGHIPRISPVFFTSIWNTTYFLIPSPLPSPSRFLFYLTNFSKRTSSLQANFNPLLGLTNPHLSLPSRGIACGNWWRLWGEREREGGSGEYPFAIVFRSEFWVPCAHWRSLEGGGALCESQKSRIRKRLDGCFVILTRCHFRITGGFLVRSWRHNHSFAHGIENRRNAWHLLYCSSGRNASDHCEALWRYRNMFLHFSPQFSFFRNTQSVWDSDPRAWRHEGGGGNYVLRRRAGGRSGGKKDAFRHQLHWIGWKRCGEESDSSGNIRPERNRAESCGEEGKRERERENLLWFFFFHVLQTIPLADDLILVSYTPLSPGLHRYSSLIFMGHTLVPLRILILSLFLSFLSSNVTVGFVCCWMMRRCIWKMFRFSVLHSITSVKVLCLAHCLWYDHWFLFCR